MSAFIVSRAHINYLANAADHLGLEWFHDGMHNKSQYNDKIGQLLWDENIKSVKHRYPTDDVSQLPGPIGEDYKFTITRCRHCFPIVPVQLIKAIKCYQYQSCEHPEWKTSEAKRVTDSLLQAAIRHLPGYNDAKWEIE